MSDLKLAEFQRHIAERYEKVDRARGSAKTFLWFIEEVGELATALHGEDRANLEEEFADVLAWCGDDMQFFNERIDKTVIETLQRIIASQFVRLSYTEAVELLLASGEKFEFPVAWGHDLQAEHERWLTEKKFQCPVILYDYPRSI